MVSWRRAVDARLQLAERSDGLVDSAVAKLRIHIRQFRYGRRVGVPGPRKTYTLIFEVLSMHVLFSLQFPARSVSMALRSCRQ